MKLRRKILFSIFVFCACCAISKNVSASGPYAEATVDGYFVPPVGAVVPFEFGEVIAGGDYTVQHRSWYMKDGSGEWQSLPYGYAFESGKDYKLCVDLNTFGELNSGNYFEDDVDIYINGEPAVLKTENHMWDHGELVRVTGCVNFEPIEVTKSPKPEINFVATGRKTGYFTQTPLDDKFTTFILTRDEGWVVFNHENVEQWWIPEEGDEIEYQFKTRTDDIYYSDSDILILTINTAQKPEGIKIENGAIVNVDEGMEWTNDTSTGVDDEKTIWNDISQQKIVLRNVGNYYIRRKASEATFASDVVALNVVEEDIVDIEETPSIETSYDIINPDTGEKSELSFLLIILSLLGIVLLYGRTKKLSSKN